MLDDISQNAKVLNNRVNNNDHLRRWCALPIPYPEAKVLGQNRDYAVLLLEDYAGRVSEMTALSQYFHHHVIFEDGYDDLSELEECISIIEMLHLELLGETIKLLGVDPQLFSVANNQLVYWNASYVYYGQSVCDRLAADIESERQAIVQYRKHQQLIADPYIRQLLERIILDEKRHIELFSQAIKKYCPVVE